MNEVLLSYIVPVYNTEPYLLRCLRSIINQGLWAQDYEILVVDDGSTDGSKAVIEELARECPQVRYIYRPNGGISAARNTALEQARGTFVQFVDSDDYLEVSKMQPLLQLALDNDLEMLMFEYCEVNGKTDEVMTPPHTSGDALTEVTTGLDDLDTHRLVPYIWSYLIRRDFLEKQQLRFDTSLIVCEDAVFATHLLAAAQRVAHCPQMVYCYVNHAESAMHNQDRDYLRRRIFSQVDAAVKIDQVMQACPATHGRQAPVGMESLRNLFLYFSMTKALTAGCVDETLARIREAGLYPFACVGPDTYHNGPLWKIIHTLMMRPALWKMLSRCYRFIK